MRDFYISRIFYTGPHIETATIDLIDGLNIICGPSDTGKSYIAESMDFMFGGAAKDFPIDKSTGYDKLHMTIKTYNGDITLSRGFEDTKIHVSSHNPDFENGDYTVGRSSKLWINNFWLQLMNIEEYVSIVATEDYSKQQLLTLRSFSNFICVKEDNIFQKSSILYPSKFSNPTATLSILLYLLYGRSYAENSPREARIIKVAKKEALKSYINSNLFYLSNYKKELANRKTPNVEFLQQKIEDTLHQITDIEGDISIAVKKSKELSNEILAINGQLAECEMMRRRFRVLRSQYQSDIKRLTFIMEGDLHKRQITVTARCPFCNGELQKKEETSCIEAAKVELEKIILQLYDVDDAETEISFEQEELSTKAQNLSEERKEIEMIVNMELRPRIESLRNDLANYRHSIETNSQHTAIERFERNIAEDLFEIESADEELGLKYKPREYFDEGFRKEFNTLLGSILHDCNFTNYSSSYFSLDNLDVVVNGKAKYRFGKGYRAFLNTTVTVALLQYLSQNGAYSPTFLLLDSPILSLKEAKDEEKISSSMKSSLFRYLVDNQEYGQTIIIENEIPDIDYGNANIIRFTHKENEGRYGLLYGVTD